MSASSQQMTSPRHAYSDFQSALPLPLPLGSSGRIDDSATTTRALGRGDLGGRVA